MDQLLRSVGSGKMDAVIKISAGFLILEAREELRRAQICPADINSFVGTKTASLSTLLNESRLSSADMEHRVKILHAGWTTGTLF